MEISQTIGIINDPFSNDPIILQMLNSNDLGKMEILTPTERVKMYSFLKNSKKYRKLSIVNANHKWTDSLMYDSGESDCSNNFLKDEKIYKRSLKVNFSDSVEMIPTRMEKSFMDTFKNLFKREKSK